MNIDFLDEKIFSTFLKSNKKNTIRLILENKEIEFACDCRSHWLGQILNRDKAHIKDQINMNVRFPRNEKFRRKIFGMLMRNFSHIANKVIANVGKI